MNLFTVWGWFFSPQRTPLGTGLNSIVATRSTKTQKKCVRLTHRALKICRETLSKFLNRRRLLDFDLAFIWTSGTWTRIHSDCHGGMHHNRCVWHLKAKEEKEKDTWSSQFGAVCWQPWRLSWSKKKLYVSPLDVNFLAWCKQLRLSIVTYTCHLLLLL